MKKIILLILLLVFTSCASVYENRLCSFKIYQDRIEILYMDTLDELVIPIEEGESVDHAYNRYMREMRRSLKRK